MKLSPEEKRNIYEEEKARIEAEEKLEKERQTVEDVSTTNLQPNVAGLLCYLGIWITGIIFLLIEQKNKFVRFHAIQSIIIFITLGIASAFLSQIPLLGWFFGVIIGVLSFVLWVVLMVKAYQGELYKVPLAGDLAEKMSAVSGGKDKESMGIAKKDEHSKPPTPPESPLPPETADSGKQTGDKAVDYFKNTKSGRITSSSLAIAWSFVLLIFFNFFNEYIAYYQYETVGSVARWVRYPILTGDFNAWLPILTTTLTLLITGHIILIILDKYILRETTLIVLNLFGIATVLTLLSIFPFDFRLIPNTIVTDISPIITAVVLIGITVGLAIGTLVSFIKLIVTVSTKGPGY